MKHGDKAKSKTASKASGKKSSKTSVKSSKAGQVAKGKTQQASKSPKPVASAHPVAAAGNGKPVKRLTPDDVRFANPIVANAFRRAVKKYPNAFRRLTD